MSEPLTKVEFCRRFVERMVTVGGETFDNGESIRKYAEDLAVSYWEDHDQRWEGPEDCADSDMSYWGED